MKLPFKLNNLNLKRKKAQIIIIVAAIVLLALIATIITISVINKKADEQGKNIQRISISSWPQKLKYYVGEEPNYDGLAIEILKNNGSTEIVKYSPETKDQFTITGFDSSKATDEVTLTVQYKDSSCKFYISVKEVPKPTPVLESISIKKMPKTEYKVGEWLDLTGALITKHYTDGTFKNTIILDSYISGWKEARQGGPGTYTLTITFEEGGVVKKTTFEITITE